MKIAFYCRVSTDEQTHDPQVLELEEYRARRQWPAPKIYRDKISGAKWTREGLDALMADARKGKIDVVLCVKLDRLGRSLSHLAQIIAELDSHKIALICTSQGIDTSDSNPAGRLQAHVLMAVAEFERSLIRERTLAGLAAARAKGRVGGRPRMALTARQEAILTRRGTLTVAQVARELGCSVGKAHALIKARRS